MRSKRLVFKREEFHSSTRQYYLVRNERPLVRREDTLGSVGIEETVWWTCWLASLDSLKLLMPWSL